MKRRSTTTNNETFISSASFLETIPELSDWTKFHLDYLFNVQHIRQTTSPRFDLVNHAHRLPPVQNRSLPEDLLVEPVQRFCRHPGLAHASVASLAHIPNPLDSLPLALKCVICSYLSIINNVRTVNWEWNYVMSCGASCPAFTTEPMNSSIWVKIGTFCPRWLVAVKKLHFFNEEQPSTIRIQDRFFGYFKLLTRTPKLSELSIAFFIEAHSLNLIGPLLKLFPSLTSLHLLEAHSIDNSLFEDLPRLRHCHLERYCFFQDLNTEIKLSPTLEFCHLSPVQMINIAQAISLHTLIIEYGGTLIGDASGLHKLTSLNYTYYNNETDSFITSCRTINGLPGLTRFTLSCLQSTKVSLEMISHFPCSMASSLRFLSIDSSLFDDDLEKHWVTFFKAATQLQTLQLNNLLYYSTSEHKILSIFIHHPTCCPLLKYLIIPLLSTWVLLKKNDENKSPGQKIWCVFYSGTRQVVLLPGKQSPPCHCTGASTICFHINNQDESWSELFQLTNDRDLQISDEEIQPFFTCDSADCPPTLISFLELSHSILELNHSILNRQQ